jgi:ankyrin repeat protein
LFTAAFVDASLVVLRILVKDLGADVNGEYQIEDKSRTALHIAAQLGFVAVMRCLVKELGADVNKGTTPDGCSPMHIAACEGNVHAVRCLVEELGADVNQATHDGLLPATSTS